MSGAHLTIVIKIGAQLICDALKTMSSNLHPLRYIHDLRAEHQLVAALRLNKNEIDIRMLLAPVSHALVHCIPHEALEHLRAYVREATLTHTLRASSIRCRREAIIVERYDRVDDDDESGALLNSSLDVGEAAKPPVDELAATNLLTLVHERKCGRRSGGTTDGNVIPTILPEYHWLAGIKIGSNDVELFGELTEIVGETVSSELPLKHLAHAIERVEAARCKLGQHRERISERQTMQIQYQILEDVRCLERETHSAVDDAAQIWLEELGEVERLVTRKILTIEKNHHVLRPGTIRHERVDECTTARAHIDVEVIDGVVDTEKIERSERANLVHTSGESATGEYQRGSTASIASALSTTTIAISKTDDVTQPMLLLRRTPARVFAVSAQTACKFTLAVGRGEHLDDRNYARLCVIAPFPGQKYGMNPSQDYHAPRESHIVDLAITGMTCSSCAARVEQALTQLPGVTASVNMALGEARVHLSDPATATDDLIQAVRAQGYGATPTGASDSHAMHDEHDHIDSAMRARIGIAVPLTVASMLLSMVPALQIDYWPVWSLICASPVVLWCGFPFHRRALAQATRLQAGMDTLISLGSLVSLGWPIWVLATASAMERMGHGHTHIYAEVAATIVTFILIGRSLEHRARSRAGNAVRALLGATAGEARLLTDDGNEQLIPVDELAPGLRVLVRPGERFPADGVIERGTTTVDTSLVTGESLPRTTGVMQEVIGGTLNITAAVTLRVTRAGSETLLARIADRVREAQAAKAAAQRLADRVSAIFVPSVIILAAGTAIGWLTTGHDTPAAIQAAVSVLVVACPCALGLATPVALLAGTGRGAQLGILVNGAAALEATRSIDVIVFDKTGTLTTGDLSITDVITMSSTTADDVLVLAAAAEQHSNHPIATSIVAAAAERALYVPRVDEATETAGEGVSAIVGTDTVTVGRPSANSTEHTSTVTEAQNRGAAVVEVSRNGSAIGIIVLEDTIRDDARSMLRQLDAMGIAPHLLSGDAKGAARAVASRLGISESRVTAGVMPNGKADAVGDLQQSGLRVAMVGDGSNDAPALASADIGIAMGGGTDVAIEAADITIMGDALPRVITAIRLSRAMWRTIVQNLGWAFGYNIAMIPLAMTGQLSPMLAAAAMAASSLCVVLNSTRLMRLRPWTPATH